MTRARSKPRIYSWWASRWLSLARLYLFSFQPGRALSSLSLRLLVHPSFIERAFAMAREGDIQNPVLTGNRASATFLSFEGGRSFSPWIEVEPLSDAQWRLLLDRIASRSLFLAELLAGRFPVDLAAPLPQSHVNLFPSIDLDLRGGCDCGADGPCLHLFALHYTLGEFLERDPFVLFELRGRPRERLLLQLHEARQRASRPSGDPSPAPRPSGDPPPGAPILAPPQPGVSLREMTVELYDPAPRNLPELPPASPPADPVAPLRALGAPAEWNGPAPAELLAPVLTAASSLAARLLAAPESIPSLRAERDADLLLSRVRALLPLSAVSLVRPALQCLRLAQRSMAGHELPEILEQFSGLLMSPRGRLDTWWKRWVPACLDGDQPIHVRMEILDINAELEACTLATAAPDSSGLLWAVGPRRASPRARTRLRRGLLEKLNSLVSEERSISLLAREEDGGEDLDGYLDVLGWSFLLDRGEALKPTCSAGELLPLAPLLRGPSLAFSTPTSVPPGAATGELPEPQVERWLWLRLLGRELLSLLGRASFVLSSEETPPQDFAARGLRCQGSLATLEDGALRNLLAGWADMLGAHPAFRGLFAP